MELSKLDRSEIVGMVAAAVLVISLFLEWFSLSTDPSVVQRGSDPANWACGVGNSSCSGWDTFRSPVGSCSLRPRRPSSSPGSSFAAMHSRGPGAR